MDRVGRALRSESCGSFDLARWCRTGNTDSWSVHEGRYASLQSGWRPNDVHPTGNASQGAQLIVPLPPLRRAGVWADARQYRRQTVEVCVRSFMRHQPAREPDCTANRWKVDTGVGNHAGGRQQQTARVAANRPTGIGLPRAGWTGDSTARERAQRRAPRSRHTPSTLTPADASALKFG